MKKILTIMRKELLDTMRDKRTLITMIVIPLLLFPILFSGVSMFTESQLEKAKSKKLNIGLISNQNGAKIIEDFTDRDNEYTLIQGMNEADMEEMVRNDSLDFGFVIAPDYDAKIAQLQTGDIKMYFIEKDEQDAEYIKRINGFFESYEDRVMNKRLRGEGLKTAFVKPVALEKKNLATQQEQFSKTLGSLIPYFFVIFAFMGCTYPAIDLFTGEKERGTIETILTSPVSRMQILLGKMGVISLTGLVSALLSLLGIYMYMSFSSSMPSAFKEAITGILNPEFILLLLAMLIPLCIFFAGLLTAISIYSKSFKEAQSLMSPMSIVIFLPLIFSFIPSVKLTFMTALVPILNIALATKEIIANTLDYGLLAVVLLSLLAFAGISVLVCFRWFDSEGNILRT